MSIVSIAIAVLQYIALWKIYVKMGRQGWEAIIPLYGTYVLFEELYGNGWKMLLLLIPFYNIYVSIKMYIDLAKRFNKSGGFAAGLILLNPIFLCILGFGDAVDGGKAIVE